MQAGPESADGSDTLGKKQQSPMQVIAEKSPESAAENKIQDGMLQKRACRYRIWRDSGPAAMKEGRQPKDPGMNTLKSQRILIYEIHIPAVYGKRHCLLKDSA